MGSTTSRFVAIVFLAYAAIHAIAQPVLVTVPTYVGATDTVITDEATGNDVPLSTATITVVGTTLTIDGRHVIESLDLQRNATNQPSILRHSPAAMFDYAGDGSDIVYGLDLTAANITVQGSAAGQVASSIDVVGRGHPAGQGPGAGQPGISTSVLGSGGGHGGQGATAGSQVGGVTYGGFEFPRVFGSGGGASFSGVAGGGGGGAVRLTISGILTLPFGATLRADGAVGSAQSGSGAGGSVRIVAGTLVGTGIISANGGDGTIDGGGGRVRVELMNTPVTSAFRARGTSTSGTGTVYVLFPGQPPTLIFDNGAAGNRTNIVGPLNVAGNVIIRGGVGLSHVQGDSAGLVLNVQGNLTVESGGTIDVNGRGYLGGQGPGAGQSGQTTATHPGGGGHGGWGGNGDLAGGPVYGSLTQPVDFGSGGGSFANALGGAGGGKVRIMVSGALTVNGVIRANGLVGASASSAGSGAGGSIWITAASVSGGGSIEANGHISTGDGGSGGGGRIAVEAGSVTFFGLRTWGSATSGTGTVHITRPGQPPLLIFDNGGIVNQSDLAGPLEFTGDVVIQGGVGLAHRQGNEDGLLININGNLTIEPSGVIDASGRGYGSDEGPGAGVRPSPTNAVGGGGYGGSGRTSDISGGRTYGLHTQPTYLGSGGGHATCAASPGGAGGGRLRINVSGTLAVHGIIRCNGRNGVASQCSGAGGGSGGSVWITAAAFAGLGLIEANGGGTTGGGGRIAIETVSNPFGGVIQAKGHGPGSVYRVVPDQTPVLSYDTAGMTNLAEPLVVEGDLVIQQLAYLSHRAQDPAGLSIVVTGNLIIESHAGIDVRSDGYPADTGPGTPPPCTSCGPGAGHGGRGAAVGGPGGDTYGFATHPTTFGSGARPASNFGYAEGGGAVRLIVGGTIAFEGQIAASGGSGTGAGGSIWISCNSITGDGIVYAEGGTRGGGGRIAIYACNNTLPSTSYVVVNNQEIPNGEPATLHLATATADTEDSTVCAGAMAVIRAYSPPNTSGYQWRFGSTILTDGVRLDGSVISGSSTAELVVSHISAASAGAYYCEMVTACGPRTSNAVSLIVQSDCPATCDGDVNCDFALDGFDVEVQERAVGGDVADYCQTDADFNGDFALDGFDVEAVEVVIGGGPCP